MEKNLFNFIDIPPENIHIPDGSLERDQYEEHCAQYEKQIRDAGGVDLALLGIGRSGHIGFNEPGSTSDTRTRMVLLCQKTRRDAASSFLGEQNVPYLAITLGVGSILESREIILIATGENKAGVVQHTLENVFKHPSDCPASYLKDHANCTFVLDEPAAQFLTQVTQPWRFDLNISWDLEKNFDMVKRAVIHVSKESGKGICELSPADFHEHHLTSLVVAAGDDVDSLCMRVMYDLMHRIAELQEPGSPLLPQNSDENLLIFSPHPDDDVICMGGLMAKLVKMGVPSKAVYMTNGSIAVDDDILRDHMRFATMSSSSNIVFGDGYTLEDVFKLLDDQNKDPKIIQQLKGNVRKAEAISAVEVLGLHENDTVFLDLPFYRTGEIKKNAIGEEDISIVLDLLVKEKPAHIFVAGDLTDPHGTHRMCYYAIRDAVKRYRAMECYRPMKIWLYRGAWQEWDVHETSVFVPLSKVEMERKINSIFKHQSQKDKALFPGNDEREFWQRARDRNRNNAVLLKQLGLPAFHAIEAFVIVDEMYG